MTLRPLALTLTLALILPAAHLASKPAAKAPRLEGVEYLKARRIVLGYGWRPFGGGCSGMVQAQTCAHYPEIDTCSGSGEGYCGMLFSKDGRCLILTTAGSAPQDEPGDTVVRDVAFTRQPCEASPTG